MALTITERHVLKIARKYIESGNQTFICHALEKVAHCNPHLTSEVIRLKTYIRRKLSPHAELGFWQEQRGIYKSCAQQRLDRLAWIDWMLGD